MKANGFWRRATSLALLPFVTGCYTQRPLAAPVPAPATRIVATVTDSGTVAMSNAIGSGAVAVEGVVASVSSDVWSLHLLRVDHRDGRSVPWNRELVSFPRNALVQPMERRVDKTKSWVAAGAIVVGAVLLGRLFNVFTSDDPTGGEPVPQESIIRDGGRRE